MKDFSFPPDLKGGPDPQRKDLRKDQVNIEGQNLKPSQNLKLFTNQDPPKNLQKSLEFGPPPIYKLSEVDPPNLKKSRGRWPK